MSTQKKPAPKDKKKIVSAAPESKPAPAAKVKATNAPQIVVRAHTCAHPYQDRVYGPGLRVFNYGKGANNKAPGYRCTVCSGSLPL